MGKPPLRIASVGECTIDHYLDLGQRCIGGISLNFAVHAKRCGAEEVSLLSRIGNDHGSRILQQLAREDIDISHATMRAGQTAVQNIVLSANGDRIFPAGGYDPGVFSGYSLTDGGVRFVQSHNVLAAAMFAQTEALFHQLHTIPFDGWRVADFLDLSDFGGELSTVERFADLLDIIFISGDEDLAERLRPVSRKFQCLVVVTLGSQGSLALDRGDAVFQPAVPVEKVVDTTGCGDAFQAAFTVSYWRDGDVRRALQRGATQASIVLQHCGAIGVEL